jgi:methyl-accepting chemotaxis protein
VIQQNSAVSEEMAATAEELASQAEHLQSTIAFFRVNGSGQGVSEDEEYTPRIVQTRPIPRGKAKVAHSKDRQDTKKSPDDTRDSTSAGYSLNMRHHVKEGGDSLDEEFERY